MGTPLISLRKNPDQRAYTVQTLWSRHHEMIRMRLLGASNGEIAEQLNVTPQNVSDVLCSPLAIQQITMLERVRDSQVVDVARAIREDAPKSLRLLQEIRDGAHGADVVQRSIVARDLLDRAGHGKVTKFAGVIRRVDDDLLQRVKEQRAMVNAAFVVNANETAGDEVPSEEVA